MDRWPWPEAAPASPHPRLQPFSPSVGRDPETCRVEVGRVKTVSLRLLVEPQDGDRPQALPLDGGEDTAGGAFVGCILESPGRGS